MTSEPKKKRVRKHATDTASQPVVADETVAAPVDDAGMAASAATPSEMAAVASVSEQPAVAEMPESGAAVGTEPSTEAFPETFGYSPQTYGMPKTDAYHNVAASLESKKQRQRETATNGDQAAGVAQQPFQETHGYSPATYRRPEYLDYLDKATVAIRTVRLYVYAGMAAFVIIAFYVFFLIYQLTTDLHRAVEQAVLMSNHMQTMTEAMTDMRASMGNMNRTMSDMDGTVRTMNGSVERMTGYINQMGNTVALMQHSARNLDQSIGPVMGAMNRFIPFGWGGNNYGGAPPYAQPIR